MGTPGMAFIRIDGDFKRIRSRYDGHVDSFGYMSAKTIQAMPEADLKQAARSYQCIDSGDESKNAPLLAPGQAISRFAEMCGDKLGERLRSTYMGFGGVATFGVPYVGLGPVLLSGRGRDPVDMDGDYSYLIDIDNGVFGLIRDEQELSLSWSVPFASLRAIEDDKKFDLAFDELSHLDIWFDGKEGKPKADFEANIQAKAAMIFKKYAGPAKAKKDTAKSDKAKAQAIIDSLRIERPAQAPANPEGGHHGCNFDFAAPLNMLIGAGVLSRMGETDSFAKALRLESSFGFSDKGAPAAQLMAVSRLDPQVDESYRVVCSSYENAMQGAGQQGSSFSSSGGGSMLGFMGGQGQEEPPEPTPTQWSDIFIGKEELLRQLGSDPQQLMRWRLLDPSFLLCMPRAEWLPQLLSGLDDPEAPSHFASFYIRYALGTADLDILEHCAAKGLIEREIARAPDAGPDLASFACLGARLTSAIDPQQGLAFARRMAQPGLSPILDKATILDKSWLLEPELPISLSAQRMQGEIDRNREFRNSMAKMKH